MIVSDEPPRLRPGDEEAGVVRDRRQAPEPERRRPADPVIVEKAVAESPGFNCRFRPGREAHDAPDALVLTEIDGDCREHAPDRIAALPDMIARSPILRS